VSGADARLWDPASPRATGPLPPIPYRVAGREKLSAVAPRVYPRASPAWQPFLLACAIWWAARHLAQPVLMSDPGCRTARPRLSYTRVTCGVERTEVWGGGREQEGVLSFHCVITRNYVT
jgi:hypothetical protein